MKVVLPLSRERKGKALISSFSHHVAAATAADVTAVCRVMNCFPLFYEIRAPHTKE